MSMLNSIFIFYLLHFLYDLFVTCLFLLINSHCISELTLQKTLKLRKKIRSLIKFRRHRINGANLGINRPIDIGKIGPEYPINFFLTHFLSVYNSYNSTIIVIPTINDNYVGQLIISLAVFIKINYENFLPTLYDPRHHGCFFIDVYRNSCIKIST